MTYKVTVDALPPSLNAFYSGMHWAKRKAIVDQWHWLFRAAFLHAKLPKKLETPLTIHVVQYCKGVVRDNDNAVVIAKLAQDSLKLFGYIPDDNPKYINKVILESVKGKANGLEVYLCTSEA